MSYQCTVFFANHATHIQYLKSLLDKSFLIDIRLHPEQFIPVYSISLFDSQYNEYANIYHLLHELYVHCQIIDDKWWDDSVNIMMQEKWLARSMYVGDYVCIESFTQKLFYHCNHMGWKCLSNKIKTTEFLI